MFIVLLISLEITGKFTLGIGIVKDQNGRSLYEAKEVWEKWKCYTEDMYKTDKSRLSQNLLNQFTTSLNHR